MNTQTEQHDEEYPSCPRCGGSADWQECSNCGGDGYDGHDCGEDCCCCEDPEDNIPCDICHGEGGWWACLNTYEWCQANPLPGKENAKGYCHARED
jgi:hypothetical protein